MEIEKSPLHRNVRKLIPCKYITLDLQTYDDALALQCVIGYATSLYLVMISCPVYSEQR